MQTRTVYRSGTDYEQFFFALHLKISKKTQCVNFVYFFLFTETVTISNQGSQDIIWSPIKWTLFIEEAQMYLCFNKRWHLVASVSNNKLTVQLSINFVLLFWLLWSISWCISNFYFSSKIVSFLVSCKWISLYWIGI